MSTSSPSSRTQIEVACPHVQFAEGGSYVIVTASPPRMRLGEMHSVSHLPTSSKSSPESHGSEPSNVNVSSMGYRSASGSHPAPTPISCSPLYRKTPSSSPLPIRVHA